MFQEKRRYPAGRLVRLSLLALLLVAVILLQVVPGWGDFYAQRLYPIIGELLSDLSGPVPFAVGDLFIALSLSSPTSTGGQASPRRNIPRRTSATSPAATWSN